jgi:hypothetical protein
MRAGHFVLIPSLEGMVYRCCSCTCPQCSAWASVAVLGPVYRKTGIQGIQDIEGIEGRVTGQRGEENCKGKWNTPVKGCTSFHPPMLIRCVVSSPSRLHINEESKVTAVHACVRVCGRPSFVPLSSNSVNVQRQTVVSRQFQP